MKTETKKYDYRLNDHGTIIKRTNKITREEVYFDLSIARKNVKKLAYNSAIDKINYAKRLQRFAINPGDIAEYEKIMQSARQTLILLGYASSEIQNIFLNA